MAGVYVMHRCAAECIHYIRQRVPGVYGALVRRRHESRHVPTRGIVVIWQGCVNKQQTPKQLHKKMASNSETTQNTQNSNVFAFFFNFYFV